MQKCDYMQDWANKKLYSILEINLNKNRNLRSNSAGKIWVRIPAVPVTNKSLGFKNRSTIYKLCNVSKSQFPPGKSS